MKLYLGFLFVIVAIASCKLKSLPVLVDDPRIGSEKGTLHVVTTTECVGSYFVFQALALKFTFEKVKQPGRDRKSVV